MIKNGSVQFLTALYNSRDIDNQINKETTQLLYIMQVALLKYEN
jgi:hypothetical protein